MMIPALFHASTAFIAFQFIYFYSHFFSSNFDNVSSPPPQLYIFLNEIKLNFSWTAIFSLPYNQFSRIAAMCCFRFTMSCPIYYDYSLGYYEEDKFLWFDDFGWERWE
jgi:hypothetical protein